MDQEMHEQSRKSAPADLPCEFEQSLLLRMQCRSVSPIDAARILGVSVPSALTQLQHLETIGIAWQLPLEAGDHRSHQRVDWELTPAGRAVAADVEGRTGSDRDRVLTAVVAGMRAA